MLFGASTEKTRDVLARAGGASDAPARADGGAAAGDRRSPRARAAPRPRPQRRRGVSPAPQRVAGRACPRAPRRSLPGVRKGQGLRAARPGRAGAAGRPGAAGGHRVRAREAALQSVRRGVHGRAAAGRRAREVRRDRGEHDRAAEVRQRAAVPSARAAAGELGRSRCRPRPSGRWSPRPPPLAPARPRRADPPGGAGRGAPQRRHHDDGPGADGGARSRRAARRPDADAMRRERTGVFTSGIVSHATGTASRCSSPGASTPGRTWPQCSPSAPRTWPADPDVRRAVAQSAEAARGRSSAIASRTRAGSSSTWRRAFPRSAGTCWRPCARCTRYDAQARDAAACRPRSACASTRPERPADGGATRLARPSRSTSTRSSPTPAWARPSATCGSTGTQLTLFLRGPARRWTTTSASGP